MIFLYIIAIGMIGLLGFYAVLNLMIALKFKKRAPTRGNINPEKVVVLVPVRDDPSIFNSHPYLVSMQYPNYHVVIIDDSVDVAFSNRLKKLNGSLTTIIKRAKHIGRKSGGLNYALEKIADLKPKYVVIFDADHRPPRNFLQKAVLCIEREKVECVCGYQKHDIGAHGLFGRYYQLSHATGIVMFQGRSQVGLSTIFGGGVAIFDYEWLKRKKFDVTSITEDWELSCRGYLDGDFSIVIRNDLYAHAAVPKGYHWFITQQLRWSEGTISDFRKHFFKILKSKLSIREKIGMFYQGLYYSQAIAVLSSIMFSLLNVHPFPLIITVPLLLLFALGSAVPLIKGGKLEGYKNKELLKMLAFAFILAYVMAPIYSYSTIRGALTRRGAWIVTRRRG